MPYKIMIVLILWIGAFDMAILAKRRMDARSPRISHAPQPFVFALPNEEEMEMIREGMGDQNIFFLPITKSVRIFSCPERTCETLGTLPAGSEMRIDMTMIGSAGEWIPISWTADATKTTIGYVALVDLDEGFGMTAPPEPPQEAMIGIEDMTIGIGAEPDAPPAEAKEINPQAIVGIVCEFRSDEGGIRDKRMTRGSGAIITNDGYIVTARSVVDLNYLNEGFEGYELADCLVGQLPKSEPLPDMDAIRKVNAFVRVPYLAYEAEIAYLPNDDGLSEYERAWLDFAILKIQRVNDDAKYFGGPSSLPEEFPAVPILISELPKIGDETLNFAFPSGTTTGFNADVRTLFMQGLVSTTNGYWAGDDAYANDIFLIENHLDTEDTAGGRFGSPIFWKGYVVGIHTAKQQGSRQIYNLATKAMLGNMADNQFIIPISVQ